MIVGDEYTLQGVDGSLKRFGWNHEDAKASYHRYCQLTDQAWRASLLEILHYSCACAYVYKVPSVLTVSDVGVIHELIHQIQIPEEPLVSLAESRAAFVLAFSMYFE